ncbi:sulfatase [Prosthecobacter sp.]|uniref:sulfatase n=1 Tax=Prosthecobacter sp. TaxID=1965333 RepID=UPI002ABB3829|nr:sulfatase [Prosthecobacter sp.]MDZ4405246.1 sulfatase [Prosthecobacter sp.]
MIRILPAFFFLTVVLHAAEKPNVIFLLADDLGRQDLGCYGSTFYETPNLDRIAKEGALFTNGYAACPVCSPTRAAVQTGRWPQRTGVTDYIGAAMKPELWKRNTLLLPAPYTDRLAHEEVTMGEMMKSSGYATFFAGKWHLGPEGYWPENQGYDSNMGGVDRGGPYGPGKYFTPYNNPRLPDGPPGEHLPDRLATETCKFIEANKNKPFFACYSFYDVHTPLNARADLTAKYEEKRKKLGLEPKFGREEPRDVRLVQEHAVYAAMVEAMDLAVGKILSKLDELDLAKNTLIIFTSDNGGLSTSEGSPTSNLPLRGGKGWLYEGGIREPLLIRWPAVLKAGQTIDTPVCSPDYFATLMDVAGGKTTTKVDGVSLRPLLEGKGDLPERSLCWHYPHYGNQGGAPGAAIRRGDWKLIQWFEKPDEPELYNLRDDLSETKNLATQEPKRVKTLLAELQAWQKDVGALLPVKNTAYNPAQPNGRIAANPAKGAKKKK